MKGIFLLFFIILNSLYCYSVKVVVDLRSTNDSDKYYITFIARRPDLTFGSTDFSSSGHAFIIWTKEDLFQTSSGFEAFGFFSKKKTGAGIFGNVPEKIVYDIRSLKIFSDQLVFIVDKEGYEKSKLVLKEWQNGQHELPYSYLIFQNECINFVQAVGKSLNVEMPAKWKILTFQPAAYIENLIGIYLKKRDIKSGIALKG